MGDECMTDRSCDERWKGSLEREMCPNVNVWRRPWGDGAPGLPADARGAPPAQERTGGAIVAGTTMSLDDSVPSLPVSRGTLLTGNASVGCPCIHKGRLVD